MPSPSHALRFLALPGAIDESERSRNLRQRRIISLAQSRRLMSFHALGDGFRKAGSKTPLDGLSFDLDFCDHDCIDLANPLPQSSAR
jgi:hypothetical protein